MNTVTQTVIISVHIMKVSGLIAQADSESNFLYYSPRILQCLWTRSLLINEIKLNTSWSQIMKLIQGDQRKESKI